MRKNCSEQRSKNQHEHQKLLHNPVNGTAHPSIYRVSLRIHLRSCGSRRGRRFIAPVPVLLVLSLLSPWSP